MSLKTGVRLTDLAPQIVLAYVIVKDIFASRFLPCVITSANDSRHGANSWHYKGRALDFRTKYAALNGHEAELLAEIREALGDEFDVVLESVGTENEHIHIEYDPD